MKLLQQQMIAILCVKHTIRTFIIWSSQKPYPQHQCQNLYNVLLLSDISYCHSSLDRSIYNTSRHVITPLDFECLNFIYLIRYTINKDNEPIDHKKAEK